MFVTLPIFSALQHGWLSRRGKRQQGREGLGKEHGASALIAVWRV